MNLAAVLADNLPGTEHTPVTRRHTALRDLETWVEDTVDFLLVQSSAIICKFDLQISPPLA